jgi:hypothetical protein
MSQDVEVRCRCGEVRGRVAGMSPRTVNRVVCYCDDCQAFAHWLGRADVLDASGGSDIIQVAPASLAFERGRERIAGMRLSPKGLHRFYADCCKTPLGNTVGPAIPFVGIVAQAFADPHAAGAPVGAILGKFAIGDAPEGSTKLNARLYGRVLRMVLGWRLSGKAWPHPFFDRATRAPTPRMTTLSRTERDALRPRCGPQAAARA